jgi:hypothetical protein
VPPNAPIELFWSVTLYDVDSRALILNKRKIADRSSRMDLLKNADGSLDIQGFEKNGSRPMRGRTGSPISASTTRPKRTSIAPGRSRISRR